MKTQRKQDIYEKLYQMKTCVEREIETLCDKVLLSEYRHLTRKTADSSASTTETTVTTEETTEE